MMLQTYFVYIKLFFVLFAAHVKAQSNQSVSLVVANPYFVAIEEGENVTIVCRAISPITSCIFTLTGEENPIILSENDNNETRSDNYEYAGNGFESGQCGITIYGIKKENNGKAYCKVDLNPHLRDIQAEIPITITKALPIDNKMRTIWGIILFTVLTVIFNIVLFYCYMQGQKSAKKTKRALSQSHTNPAATNITASEQMNQTDVEKQQTEAPSSSTSQPVENK